MPRTKKQNLQIKDDRREQILSAALQLFSKRGLAATKISDIAATANLSHGLVYHYFESKESIYIELVSHAIEQSALELGKIATMSLKPLDKLQFIYESIVKNMYDDDDSAYYFLIIVQALVSDANPEEIKKLIPRTLEPVHIMMKIVEEGQQKGHLQEGDPYDYVMLHWAALAGLAPFRISMGQNFRFPKFDLFVNMLKK